MHRQQIKPDSSTCSHVFSAYVEGGFHSTAVEALQVLSTRMLSDGTDLENEKLKDYLGLAKKSKALPWILKFFSSHEDDVAIALLNLRLCATLGYSISWSPDLSPWARRLSISYDSRDVAASLTPE